MVQYVVTFDLKSKLDISNEKIMYELSKSETEKSKLESLLDEELKTIAERYNSNLETEKSIGKKEIKFQKDESFQYTNLAASINSKIKPFRECVLCKSDKVSSQKVSDTKKNKQKDEVQVNAKNCDVYEKNEVTTSMVWFNYEALQVSCIKDSILPSFTCSPNPNVIMRCIADSGCQVNFIEEEFVNINKFKTVNKSFELIINLFDAKKELKIRIVEVRLNIGDKYFIVNAICIPKINIHINLPGINRIGYKLADAFLLQGDETISDIKFILGTNSAHCLPVSTEVFGKEIDCAASSYF
ncbi:hypothetical protein Avbf_09072 [Armadillidium vulgare]|nr:hypothetical protein Avbf_09072 [Armadillidium vulgare]